MQNKTPKLTGNKQVKIETNKQKEGRKEGRLANFTATKATHCDDPEPNQSPLLLSIYRPKIFHFLLGFVMTTVTYFELFVLPSYTTVQATKDFLYHCHNQTRYPGGRAV